MNYKKQTKIKLLKINLNESGAISLPLILSNAIIDKRERAKVITW